MEAARKESGMAWEAIRAWIDMTKFFHPIKSKRKSQRKNVGVIAGIRGFDI